MDSTLSILRIIHQSQPVTRKALCEQTGLSLGSVNSLVSQHLAKHVVCEEVVQDGTPGRPAASLFINPDLGRVVGLDIGGELAHAVLADINGRVLASIVHPTQVVAERSVILADMARLVEAVCQEGGTDPATLTAVGLGLRAIVDVQTGKALGWPNTPAWAPAWSGLDVAGELRQRLGVEPIVVEDSVRAMGVTAHRFGPVRHSANFLYVFLGEGIGSALMVDGEPYRGSKGLAGEIGHITVEEEGAWCSCGNRGCLEVMASTAAVLRRTRQRLSELPMDSALRGRFERNELTLTALLEATRAGDKIAFQILDEAGAFVGQVIAIALNVLGPESVVLGGPLTVDDGIILRAVQRQVRLHALRQISSQTQIVYDSDDEFAGAHGMAALALDAVFNSPERLEQLCKSELICTS